MVNDCPLCSRRVSNWVMCQGKATEGTDNNVYHNSCVIDYELRYGKVHPAVGRSLQIVTAKVQS